MIYLITGSPGTGKTSMVVDMILNNYDGLFKIEKDGQAIDRPLYFCHIDGLDAKKFKAHELTEDEIKAKPLNELLPVGSVLLVDECDYCYPTRSNSKDVPPYIKTLKELRHHGFTLILMTQHPTMIDKYLRNLVGKHIHLERKHLGTKRYEWFRCEENLNETAFKGAVQSIYKPPKAAFKYYKSAMQHIKFNKKRPIVFVIAPLILIVFAFLSYKFLAKFINKEQPPAEQAVASAPVALSDAPVQASTPVIFESASMPLGASPDDYAPRIEGLPETAPLYDSLRNPVNMPTVAACVKSANSCNCYTEQATRIYVPAELCAAYVEHGIFDIYRPHAGDNVAQSTSQQIPLK